MTERIDLSWEAQRFGFKEAQLGQGRLACLRVLDSRDDTIWNTNCHYPRNIDLEYDTIRSETQSTSAKTPSEKREVVLLS